MHVRMLTGRMLQDAGVERPLTAGEAYDLPAVVAWSLIATGAAMRDEPMRGPRVAPETKPAFGHETKRSRRA